MKIKTKKKSKGQGLVEFALTLPVVLLLMFGMIEFGRLLFIYSSVVTASREAVRYGTAVGKNASGIPRYLDCTGIQDRALTIARFAGVDPNQIVVTYLTDYAGNVACASLANPNDVRFGDQLEVSTTVTWTPLTQIFFSDIPSFPINSVARRSIIKAAKVVD